ncbi:uncharacterized protein FPRO_15827 [Fusarium proliferatum ET1]|uniref:Uncharacterized protein n=1 Tax=Fusarium proliferatum (strain ET1) TaxID=1227346 RepID=A0A1L7WA36_FUSPR|nr:uncharacterized protein FPRO_15827 [Fusarium proliferatum ET1]CZR49467.1 uncharacterized protein FPRO_15827 [Fusarium proliferatum ET1]
MAGQVKGKAKSDNYHPDSESEADNLLFTGVRRSERARQILRLIAHLEQADSLGHAEIISKLKDKKVELAWIHGLAQLTPESQTEEQWLKSWDRRKGNVTSWITNNIENWSETMAEEDKKRLTDVGKLLMEQSSRGAIKQHAANNEDLPTHDDLPTKANDASADIFELTRLEESAESSADTASGQGTEENNQQDHKAPPTTEVSKTNEPSRHVTPSTPEKSRDIERVLNRFEDYLARQDMFRSALNQQDNPRIIDKITDWFLQRQALRARDERIARDRGYGIKWRNEKADLYPLDKAVRRAEKEKARAMGKKVRWDLDGAKFE